MSNFVTVRYARKPTDLDEVKSSAKDRSGYAYDTAITETVALTTSEYDAFTRSFLRDYAWLTGKGGVVNKIHQAVAVTAPERLTLYVNPEGSSYGRYVGLEVPPELVIKHPDVHVRLTGQDGNAFNILGICQRAAKKAHVPAEDIKAFMDEASSGDYDHLLATCQQWFDCY
ncbi:MAG: hypothetical protein K2X09_00575 [Rickettsiales bacterium]|nr:hypothetical protein [Rickettsiales bacterium]